MHCFVDPVVAHLKAAAFRWHSLSMIPLFYELLGKHVV